MGLVEKIRGGSWRVELSHDDIKRVQRVYVLLSRIYSCPLKPNVYDLLKILQCLKNDYRDSKKQDDLNEALQILKKLAELYEEIASDIFDGGLCDDECKSCPMRKMKMCQPAGWFVGPKGLLLISKVNDLNRTLSLMDNSRGEVLDSDALSKSLSDAYALAEEIYHNIQLALSGSGVFTEAIKDLSRIKTDGIDRVVYDVHTGRSVVSGKRVYRTYATYYREMSHMR